MRFKSLTIAVVIAGIGLATVSGAHALPFNQDMAEGQNRPAGTIMRSRVSETVPVGSLERRTESKDEAEQLKNPKAGDKNSAANGERLFAVNCSPCHGKFDGITGDHTLGAVYQYMPGPDLSSKDYAARTDGHIYSYIHFGGALMPRYGWKLSPDEHWDIINYIRKVQAAKNPAK